ncbi:YaeQ family protein [Aestuariicella hydrocarbonica]|uniref:YaeQ family protein n=1 Tax=Pseudomaricurvus hydrocarbonicus TaxID=1470433 RepID=A0A9E5MPF8_9GAMM|nr:YaeQ family protein [Aestuariicella hydrocarbonica]NHO68016.1 YaeQ family protein [Aestuariicella hydrocarbonica]
MALKATVFKATINIADMDRYYYDEHVLTLARHPSETDLRMMARLAVFALNAEPRLNFTKGISTDSEPDLWIKDYSDQTELWIELGQPDEKRLRQACGKAQAVKIYCYSGRSAELWWQQTKHFAQRFDNLTVINLHEEGIQALSELAQRNMSLHCNIEDQEMSVSDETTSVIITQEMWKG